MQGFVRKPVALEKIPEALFDNICLGLGSRRRLLPGLEPMFAGDLDEWMVVILELGWSR